MGCELLSKVYIFDIRNNLKPDEVAILQVVNCFQKFISLILETTLKAYIWETDCCELLSKVYIFDIRNNCCAHVSAKRSVVNCFQKFISLILETTRCIHLAINQKYIKGIRIQK